MLANNTKEKNFFYISCVSTHFRFVAFAFSIEKKYTTIAQNEEIVQLKVNYFSIL